VSRYFENICPRFQVMKLGVASEQMRRLVTTITDAVGASLWTPRRLPFLRAVIAFTAGGRRSPGDAIPDVQGLTGPVTFQSVTEPFDTPDRLMSEDDRQRNRKLAFPEMDVGAANARHSGSHQRRAGFESGREREFAKGKRRTELFENGSCCVRHAVGDFVQTRAGIQRRTRP